MQGVLKISEEGNPLGLTPGPKMAPFGAAPESPFGEVPGPRGTPFGATEGFAASLSWNDVSSSQSEQWRSPSIIPSYGQGRGVVDEVDIPLSPLGCNPGNTIATVVVVVVVVHSFAQDCP